jgi:hypothetical protein
MANRQGDKMEKPGFAANFGAPKRTVFRSCHRIKRSFSEKEELMAG